jgi:ribulose-5-phosphate 4-epimerase/fuculose-1-phosphate aldolase
MVVDPKSKKGYQERFIHSEIYKRFPHVNSVVHSHSEAVLPYTMSGVPMRPTFHIAGFLGNRLPLDPFWMKNKDTHKHVLKVPMSQLSTSNPSTSLKINKTC